MGNWDELAVRDFGIGLVTNISSADADKTSFRTFKNTQPLVPGLLSALPGAGTAQVRVQGVLTNIPSLPSGFSLESGCIFHILTPQDTDVVVIFGSKGGRDRFYVWPNITSVGNIETTGGSKISNVSISWLELTEAEALTITTVNNPGTGTNLTISGLSNNTSTDYYNTWYLWNNTRSYFDYIIDHASTTLTTKFGSASAANGDTIILMRFPIFIKSSIVSAVFQIAGSDLPVFARHAENLVIHTGVQRQNNSHDLWLGYIGKGETVQGYFNDNDLDFNGWHFDAAQPWLLKDSDVISGIVATGASTDALPYSGSGSDFFNIVITGLWDGSQESNLQTYADNALTPSFGKPSAVEITSSSQHATISLAINIRTDQLRQSQFEVGSTFPTLWSRRIKKLSFYITAAETVNYATGDFREKAEYFFVKELDIDDASFSLSAGQYIANVTIKGSEYKTAQAFPFSTVNGYINVRIGSTTTYEAEAGGRTFIAPVYDTASRPWRVLFSPSARVSPDVFPVSNRIDVPHHGIYEIVGIIEQFGRLLIFGRERFVAVDVIQNEGQISEAFQKVGCIASRALKNLEGLVFFPSDRQMFEIYDGSQIMESPAERLRDIWKATSIANKEAAFAGIHRDRREYWIAFTDADSAQRIFVYSLKYGVFFEYDSNSTYVDFVEGVDGNLYGLTSSSFVELVSNSPTESLAITVKSQTFNETPAKYRRLALSYLSPSALTVVILDEDQISALQTIETLLFLDQANLQESDPQAISLDTHRCAWQLSRAGSTDVTFKVDHITLSRRPLHER